MKKLIAAALVLLPLLAAAAEVPPGHTLEDALKQARARHAPVFVDFWAPWCHSCFFMQSNVMNGAEWEATEKRAIVVELDGDEPEGNYWARLWKIGGYPTYVILDENGEEIGRILGDRPRGQFYAELNPILDKGAALDTLKQQVRGTDPASIAAGRAVLKALYERQDFDGAQSWMAALPGPVQEALRRDPDASAHMQRIALLQAADAKDPAKCIALATPVLGGALSCDVLYEMSQFQSCLDDLPEAERRTDLAPYESKVASLQKHVLVDADAECSDTRGIVDTAADLYEALGDTAAFDRVWQQGIAYSKQRLQGPDGIDFKKDHYLTDNMRYYMERAQDTAGLDALYPKLIAAYPDTYDYYFRYGRGLAKRGEYAKALPYLDQAAERAYGRNKLWVAEWRAQTLMQLKQQEKAQAVVAEALEDNGPWFPDDVKTLKAVLDGTAPG
jgi:thiol-disulfide isomerase/thioredoxin